MCHVLKDFIKIKCEQLRRFSFTSHGIQEFCITQFTSEAEIIFKFSLIQYDIYPDFQGPHVGIGKMFQLNSFFFLCSGSKRYPVSFRPMFAIPDVVTERL